MGVSSTGSLPQALQASLDAAGSAMQVISAAVDWSTEADTGAEDNDSHALTWGLVAAALALVLLLALLVVARWACRRADSAKISADTSEVVDAEAAEGKNTDSDRLPKDAQWEVSSVSTGSPESESNLSERPSTAGSVEPPGTGDVSM